jgi:uncharacterized protein YdhG (YjbR/CyaY superfamily)
VGERRPTPTSVEAYLATFTPTVRQRLEEIRGAMRAAAPEATEVISYGIGALALNGSAFVFFAGFEGHVSVYPVLGASAELQQIVAPYLSGKATARFDLDHPIPTEVVAAITRANLARAAARGGRKRKG